MGSKVKLANDLYLETSSIVHNDETLDTLLDDIDNRYGNIGINTRGELGLNSSQYFYLRGMEYYNSASDCLQYQLNATPTDLRYQKNENGTWTNIWVQSGTAGDFITVTLASDYTLSSTAYTTLPFKSIYFQNGSSLSLTSDGGIKIGAGIKAVAVSGQYYFYTGTTGQKCIQILKNSTVVSRNMRQGVTNYTTIDAPVQRFNVTEGDTIYLQMLGANGDLIKDYDHTTHFSVEVIK